MNNKKMVDDCCYMLLRSDGGASYCGTTNCLVRRVRQHNGQISGGARYTSRRRTGQTTWRPAWAVRGFASRAQTLSFEWHLKRASAGCGPPERRRERQLQATLSHGRWWKVHGPCPRILEVIWWGTTPPVIAGEEGTLPFSNTLTAGAWPPAMSVTLQDDASVAVVCKDSNVPQKGLEVSLEAVHGPSASSFGAGPAADGITMEYQRLVFAETLAQEDGGIAHRNGPERPGVSSIVDGQYQPPSHVTAHVDAARGHSAGDVQTPIGVGVSGAF